MRNFWNKLKHHANSIAFISGFIYDNVMLYRIDQNIDHIFIGGYIIIAGLGIILYNKAAAKSEPGKVSAKIKTWAPLVFQFVIGGLFSSDVIFYSRSASLGANWPFILFLAVLFIGNELFRKRYEVLTFQISIYFVVLFSYMIFAVPVLLHAMGPWVFILSGVCSLVIIRIMVIALSRLASERHERSRLSVSASIIGIYLLFNFAYFANIIPPVPLSLKEIGVYHSVTKNASGDFAVSFEPAPWYLFFESESRVYNSRNGEPVYVLSSIFAPTKLSIPVFHKWSYLDPKTGKWVETDKFKFAILGGRDSGYRIYSAKKSIFPGQWRIDVTTDRNQLIGRLNFEVRASAPEELRLATR